MTFEELSNLEYGWDGRGAEPPTADQLKNARTVCDSLKSFGLPEPSWGLDKSNDIRMRFKNGSCELEVFVFRNTISTLYVRVFEKG